MRALSPVEVVTATPHIVAVFAARKWKDNEDKMMTIVRIDGSPLV